MVRVVGHKQPLGQEAMVVLGVVVETTGQGRHRPAAELVTLEVIRQQKVQMEDPIKAVAAVQIQLVQMVQQTE